MSLALTDNDRDNVDVINSEFELERKDMEPKRLFDEKEPISEVENAKDSEEKKNEQAESFVESIDAVEEADKSVGMSLNSYFLY